MKSLFGMFAARSPNKVFVCCLLGVMAGIAYAMLIPLVTLSFRTDDSLFEEVETPNRTFLSFEVANYEFARLFMGTCLIVLICRTSSHVMLTHVSMSVTAELKIDLYRRFAAAPTFAVEQVGGARFNAALSNDIPKILAGAKVIPYLLINGVTVIGMLGFLSYLNISVFFFVLKGIFFGAVSYQLPLLFSSRYFSRARTHLDGLYLAVEGLIRGSKELKLNRRKRDAYFTDVLVRQEYAVMRADKAAYSIMNIALNYGDLISFFVIGAISFIFVNYHSVTQQELIGSIMTLLYIASPIGILLNFSPDLAVAKTSLRNIEHLIKELPEETEIASGFVLPPWDTIRFNGVTYQYGNTDNGFKIGPLDFEIKKAAITFIVGGNGSGKSTLSKLITQHYLPSAGTICFGAIAIDAHTRRAARNEVCAIYPDYHLFTGILGTDHDDRLQAAVDGYLRVLDLDRKVTFSHGKFSTLNLSDGQKRRLALLVAYVEDKAMYLFDEWAADQDPAFKLFFYRTILPQLKAQGKAIVVISHDEQYFDVADELLIMHEGRLVKRGAHHTRSLDNSYA